MTDRVMSIDAAGYRYADGPRRRRLVNDPLDTIHQVARAYGIQWLVLERDDGVAALGPVLDGDAAAWIGPPIVTIPGPTGAPAATSTRSA